ncbi:MAG: putative DNA binding domain-containing protein [Chloroflexota bacterium]|nr:putative DNA binding domain-containing protein [Chloroflexota bacterium]
MRDREMTVNSEEFMVFLESLGEREAVDLEFKEAGGGLPQSIWETVCAFANTSGGTIVLGVREQDGQLIPVGVPNAGQRIDDLYSQSRNRRKINRDVFSAADIALKLVDGKQLIVVTVRPLDRRARPVYLNGQMSTGTYLRRHSGDYVASEDEVKLMVREAIDLPADQVILPWVKLEFLDREAVGAYRRRLLSRTPGAPWEDFSEIEFLAAIEGFREDFQSGESGITVAGLLMFGRPEIIRAWRTRHLIDARVLPRGADVSEPDWDDRITWEGHLFGAYERLQRWLTQDLPAPFKLDEDGVRVEEFPGHVALREALVNLLVHADYAETGASLILRWDGGVRFRNPGRSRVPQPGAPGGNRSDPRNRTLVRMFRLIGWAEEAGTGIPRMIRAWRKLGYEPPEIDPGSEQYEFTITLPYEFLLSDDDRTWLEGLNAEFTDAEQLALVIARQEGGVDNQAVRAVTGVHGADVSRILTGLRDRGFLEMAGSKRGARYFLSQRSADTVASSSADSGLELVDSTAKSVDSGLELVDSDAGLGEDQATTKRRAQLQQIAAPAAARAYLSREAMLETIVLLCSIEPLTVQEMAEYLNRTKHHVGQMVREMVSAGKLQPFEPSRRLNQRYVVPEKG